VTDRRDFQPMNANYGLFPPLETRERGHEKRLKLAARAARDLNRWIEEHGVDTPDTVEGGQSTVEVVS
jgi:methylenetetrahydrofolate--tRNA-(uracil-5-)-methyltransferase